MKKSSLREFAHHRCDAAPWFGGRFPRRTALRRRAFLFIFAACFSVGIAAQNLPETIRLPRAKGFVNDFAGIMTSQDAQAAESLAFAVKEKTGAELAIVTVESYAPYAVIDEFSLSLAQSWGIGERGRDTGVLIVLSMTEREVKIEVGYGLEGVIPDSAAGRILDASVIPAFRNGDFSGGLLKGLEAIAALVVKDKGIELDGFDLSEAGKNTVPEIPWAILLPIFIWIVLFIFSFSMSARRVGRSYGSGSFGGRSRGFSSSRSFGGGGFGGFGGGSFGGGGASRRF